MPGVARGAVTTDRRTVARTGDGAWLGIDIGATKLAVRTERGDVRRTTIARWSDDDDDRAVLTRALVQARIDLGGRVDGVGVASAPTVDGRGRVTAWPSRPRWVGFDLLDSIARVTDAPVVAADDGNVAALAEAEAVGCPDLAFIGIGTGLGGGLVTGGRLVTGAFGSAGEIGHIVLDPAGPVCVCGRRGCLQATVSGPVMAARASRLRRRPTSTTELVAGVRDGRRWALEVRDAAARALARVVVLLSELVQPSRVHLGGGLGAAMADLPALVVSAAGSLARPGRRFPVVAAARLGPEASLAGAILLSRRGLPGGTGAGS